MLIFNSSKLGTSLPRAPAIRDLHVTHYNDMLLQMNVLSPTLHMIRMDLKIGRASCRERVCLAV